MSTYSLTSALDPSRGIDIFRRLDDLRTNDGLPSLQALVGHLRTLTLRAHSSVDEITALVRMDQTLALNVLRLANSAYYAPRTPIVEIPAAILYMGLDMLRKVVASTRCLETTFEIDQSLFDWSEFWIHSAAVGQMTLHLASNLEHTQISPESYYVMGLLHDIGKVVLAAAMPEEFDEIYRLAADGESTPEQLEMKFLGVEHGMLGAWFMEKQGIPLSIREPVRFHHSQPRADMAHIENATLVHLADALVLSAGLGQSGNCVESEDPFASRAWTWFLSQVVPQERNGKRIRANLMQQLEETSHLVRSLIVPRSVTGVK